ncbi:ADP-ribosylation factor-like protein 16 [Asbolus verrucosus]|uniref:ADP-ribosylation factor-like protein 16 n=1 Tax=Asbolus verrucosus TaxID=1661398 RepID=A0A482VRT7_ASBVE|nr:ADP-ribosylation factor-like protein 16 [Asbolus verrucosus]
MTLCLGPTGSGKTLLLKKLQNIEKVDTTATSVPTVGTNMFTIKADNEIYQIRELGGVMSPLWPKYFDGIQKIIYVVDASNLCQISAAGVLLYTIIANPALANAKFLLVLTKMDVSYRQMRNEALLMLQMRRFDKEIRQKITISEASAVIVLVFAIFQLVNVNCSPVYEDLEGAASDHEYGRVQIKVFRGPTEHSGHDYFAPWGYWVKQPADDHH